ncbi:MULTISPECIES: tRNA(Ile)(2)-agmatinylcytidine synthase [Fervidicoccus]|uniref:tRNA(Ile2) 2-agmatinylcytidine synthetase TiaS n=2 Tax=Fervidicoccus fontis TaxID=683846 RepID=I0A1D8_FERFK|nr:tRNA(Ile)(2)-agmatinylcytidine synthase [Fervidicoccus fontis]AFH42795.1 putative DNA-binding protein (regulator) [Fervidicoccus fontis Kam940]PMB76871.1 MAG: 30S ribosomal protein S27ae [Fervidicoccus fontis]HEW64144.1 DUF1743 domain-containing protein [Fervidicoccus fontis]
MKHLAITLDGYDTNFSGCTTHYTIFLIKKILKEINGAKLVKGPYLVRLNPNIPLKTRGNASVSFLVDVSSGSSVEKILSLHRRYSEKYSSTNERNGKGTILISEDPVDIVKKEAYNIYKKALSDYVPIIEGIRFADKFGLVFEGEKSIIGAVSALGYMYSGDDSTFELLAYRMPGETGERKIDNLTAGKVLLSYKTLFNNFDEKRKLLVASPKGPDPVLIGIRGYEPKDMVDAFYKLKIEEKIWEWCIFKTNQHTDAHKVFRRINDLRVYQAAYIYGTVTKKPEVKKGGHVLIEVSDGSGTIDVIFYSETNPMNEIASRLKEGDNIGILGGAVEKKDEGIIFEAEKLWVYFLSPTVKELNPLCPKCGKRLKSAGKGKGYKCDNCGFKTSEKLEKIKIIEKRDILFGPYTPRSGRIRHLVKPASLESIVLPKANDDIGNRTCSF